MFRLLYVTNLFIDGFQYINRDRAIHFGDYACHSMCLASMLVCVYIGSDLYALAYTAPVLSNLGHGGNRSGFLPNLLPQQGGGESVFHGGLWRLAVAEWSCEKKQAGKRT